VADESEFEVHGTVTGRVPRTHWDEAIRALDALPGEDPEPEHSAADRILLDHVPMDVAQAYRNLQERCSWWATA
jgi:hypothetical protein